MLNIFKTLTSSCYGRTSDRSASATHNGRKLKKGLFSKVINYLKRKTQKNSAAKLALRVEKTILEPLNNTADNRKNPVAKLDAAMPDSAVQARIKAAANVKLAFETSVTEINKSLDDIGASINELARPLAKPEPALTTAAINALSDVQVFMKNNASSANARKASGQPSANAVVKFDKLAMRSILNSIRANMRDVFIAEAKAKPEDKELYIFWVKGLLDGLGKAQVSMKAAAEEAVKFMGVEKPAESDKSQSNSDGRTIGGSQESVDNSDYDTVKRSSSSSIYKVAARKPMYVAFRNWVFSIPSGDTPSQVYDTVPSRDRTIYQIDDGSKKPIYENDGFIEPIYEEIPEPNPGKLFSLPIDDTSRYEMPPPLPPRNRKPSLSNIDSIRILPRRARLS